MEKNRMRDGCAVKNIKETRRNFGTEIENHKIY